MRGFPAAKAELETAVLEAMERGASEWPALELSAEPFAEALGRAIAAATDPAAALGAVEAGDLFLATACLAGIPGATLVLEQSYGAEIDAALRARDKHDSAAADLRQSARERLLVGTGGRRPKLAEYSGAGALLHWLRVVLVRMRIDARRHEQRAPAPAPLASTDGELADEIALDPELAYLKSHYRELMQAAFVDAVAELEPRERLALRYQLVEHLNTERIGALFGVHAATARRWVASARDRLWSSTRAGVMRRLGIRPAEFDSIVRLVRSELDMSVVRLLGSTSE